MSDSAKKIRNLVLTLIVCISPFFIYQYGGSVFRGSEQAKLALDTKVENVFLVVTTTETVVIYQDGTRVPVDGMGVAALTWADYEANPGRLAAPGYTPKEADFPVVVCFNPSGFDSSGDAAVVRRAKDGSVVFTQENKPKMVRVVAPDRDGTFRVYFQDGTKATVSEKDWYAQYMSVTEAPVLPPPEEIDKMTPEQLKKIGIERLTKEEYEKKFGTLPPMPPGKETGPKPKEAAVKTGIRGTVTANGKGVKVPIALFAGKIVPTQMPAGAVATGVTGDDGAFSVAVPPGVYTILANYKGKWYGNALNQATWPSFEVKDGWVEYEFRLNGF